MLQCLLKEVQSASGLCPAVITHLLEALKPQHRQQLSNALKQLRQQQIQQGITTLDDTPARAAAADTLAQQLQQLSAVDILLMMSLQQQQSEADIAFPLMTGILEAPR